MGETINLKIEPFGDCVYCSEEGKQLLASRGIAEHMTIFKRTDGHMHVHGPIKNEPLIVEMIGAICSEVGIAISTTADEEKSSVNLDVEVKEAEIGDPDQAEK